MTELSKNHPTEIKKQNYICCLYDNYAWIGLVEDVSEGHGDFFLSSSCILMDPPSYFSGLILMTLVGCMRLTYSASLVHPLWYLLGICTL